MISTVHSQRTIRFCGDEFSGNIGNGLGHSLAATAANDHNQNTNYNCADSSCNESQGCMACHLEAQNILLAVCLNQICVGQTVTNGLCAATVTVMILVAT
eukprot:TRINITY_DN9969_c0_g2_i5.p2 TRINITY_DN9969_c0_g2~~TRINITY_DN9969_c0_g2_i5.p2  ORF type:complete len:117 (+),score=36.89 TRINITY_DN9969_c0_g2_i5:54-353(+)